MDASSNPTVTHIVHSIGRSSFGLGAVAAYLAAHQRCAGLRARIWCLDDERELSWACNWYGLPPKVIQCFPRVGPPWLYYTPRMEHLASVTMLDEASVIHQHGIWTGLSRVTRKWANRTKLPAVVAAHGALAPLMRQISSWKKWLALLAYERENLESAACLHALSATEAEQYRAFGLRNPIAVIPNGMPQAWLDSCPPRHAFREKLAVPADTRVMLYLGRLVRNKGLSLLVEALSESRRLLDGWKIVIAGVDERDYRSELEAQIARLNLAPYFVFPGPLFGNDKREAYAAADLFVLPSYSEGCPVGVMEALGAGVAVLTTTGVPVQELRSGRYGWYVEPSTDALSAALKDALPRSRRQLGEFGQRGRQLIQRQYTWARLADRTAELYRWLLGQNPRPDFVLT
ncbi:MAG TPA: glycosyltransferase [Bryobacteraceae bacterium]|nr:glycosyltransferase [Bryobacteraceae bacterium]